MSIRTFPPTDLPVVVSAWEIECCAPPAVVGERTSWRLALEPVATPDLTSLDRVPGSVTRLLWQVAPWPAAGDGRALYRHGVATYCYEPNDPKAAQLPPGRQMVRGVLFGTRHGGSVHDLFPTVSAIVSRIQVISCEFRQQERAATPIPGSTKLVDVQQSPKWFTRRPPGPTISVPIDSSGQWRRRVTPSGSEYRAETGILLTIRDIHADTSDEPNGSGWIGAQSASFIPAEDNYGRRRVEQLPTSSYRGMKRSGC